MYFIYIVLMHGMFVNIHLQIFFCTKAGVITAFLLGAGCKVPVCILALGRNGCGRMKKETGKKPQKQGNIVLSGFMGSGKSTVGRRLAAALNMKFIDMDRYIEKKTGKTVSEIFSECGEMHFRALETETARTLSRERHYVIATGGGTLMREENVKAFHEGGGRIYYLDVPLRALQERLKNDKRRPLLQTEDRNAVIEKLLNERRPKYLNSADVVVDAGAPIVVVVRRICALRGIEPDETALALSGRGWKNGKKHTVKRRNSADEGSCKYRKTV